MHFQAKNTFKNTLYHNPKHDKKKYTIRIIDPTRSNKLALIQIEKIIENNKKQ